MVILWSVVSHIAVADERPSGIQDDAKYVKVDRVTDGDASAQGYRCSVKGDHFSQIIGVF